MCDIVDLEEALKKTGAELFKELYRIYPTADPEDYFRNGQWRNDVLKADLTLMEAHRREAGAPDMPDLDEIKFPQMPVQTSSPTLGAGFVVQQMKQQQLQQQQQSSSGSVGAAVGNQVVEIRLIALFVAKWKLDPVSAKESLSKLSPARRRYVIQHFKSTSSGVEATEELKKFIAECEKDGKWDIAAATASTAAANGTLASPVAAKAPIGIRPTITPKISPAAVTVRPAITPKAAAVIPATGLKRPISATVSPPAWAANKRPVLAAANTIAPPKTHAITPPKAGAGLTIKPPKAGGATIRPPVRPAGKLVSNLLKEF
jgi:hypothetical protein